MEEKKLDLKGTDYSPPYRSNETFYRHVIIPKDRAHIYKARGVDMNVEWRKEHNLPMGVDWVHYGWFENAALFWRPRREGEEDPRTLALKERNPLKIKK